MPFLLIIGRISAWLQHKSGWMFLIGAIFCHYWITYLALGRLGEESLVESIPTFTYWYITTVATVGYGDISPKTDYGRLLVAYWVMVGGIALLTALIGGTTAVVAKKIMYKWRARMKGTMGYNLMVNHTIIIGWVPGQTDRMIELLQVEKSCIRDRILLCADNIVENPDLAKCHFVRGESLLDKNLLERTGLSGAKRVIICCPTDEQTLSVTLSVNALKPRAHLVSYFQNAETAKLAKSYVPGLEVAAPMVSELLVRAARDPGVSDVIGDLLSINHGSCLFQGVFRGSEVQFGAFSAELLVKYSATLIGVRSSQMGGLSLSCFDQNIYQSDEVYYISQERLPEEAFQ